jgi:hypothetical protein
MPLLEVEPLGLEVGRVAAGHSVLEVGRMEQRAAAGLPLAGVLGQRRVRMGRGY